MYFNGYNSIQLFLGLGPLQCRPDLLEEEEGVHGGSNSGRGVVTFTMTTKRTPGDTNKLLKLTLCRHLQAMGFLAEQVLEVNGHRGLNSPYFTSKVLSPSLH